MKRALHLACVAICLGVFAPGFAQQGHPLTGTWSGDWGATSTQRHQITFVMNWDGKNITGLINPGPDSIPIASVFVDVTNWTVRIEANGKDHITAEGKLEDLGSYHRTIKGTWTQGSTKGDFRITRD
ncbi:MAG: hypothetical protein LAO55_05490 [Acidobacteriia bacterium]|nr:hypothetical protein [Terriglobia bacterium]